MSKRLALLVTSISLLASPAAALDRANFEMRTVADLVALCDPPENDKDRWYGIVYCRGYLRGLGDFGRAFLRPGALGICLPTPRPTVAALGDGFVGWAKSNPAELQNPDIVGTLLRWAGQAYPCAANR